MAEWIRRGNVESKTQRFEFYYIIIANEKATASGSQVNCADHCARNDKLACPT